MDEMIIVNNPNINSDIFRRFLIDDKGERQNLINSLKERQVTPEGYPRVIDLGAGEGGVALALSEAGWERSNIVNVDWCKPNDNNADGCEWRFWDLGELVDRLDDPNLPEEIQSLKQSFDLAVSVNVTGENLDLGNLCKLAKYFCKPGGFIWVR